MGLKELFKKGEQLVEDRGGVDSLKDDALELKDIATGEGSVTDKFGEAQKAVADPGAPGESAPKAEVPEPAEPPIAPPPETPQAAPAAPSSPVEEPPVAEISPPAAVPPGAEPTA
jgi:hypothetical protein